MPVPRVMPPMGSRAIRLDYYEEVRILTARTGFKETRRRLVDALVNGAYQHEARSGISVKNLLQTGRISAEALCELVKKCQGQHHTVSPHHTAPGVEVHVLRRDGWYVKFYFVGDPDTVFISVHR